MARTSDLSPQQKTSVMLSAIRWIGIVMLGGLLLGGVYLITDTWKEIKGTSTDFNFTADASLTADGSAKLDLNSKGGEETKSTDGPQVSKSFDWNAFSLIFLVAGFVGVMYGIYERRLRQDRVAHLASRVSQLERELDPKKLSSGLTPSGTTNPKDK